MLKSVVSYSGNILSGNIGRTHLASGVLLVFSGQVQSGSVEGFFGATRHVVSGTLGVFDFGSGAVIAGVVGSGAIQSGNIASGQIGGSHYGSGSIGSGAYASGSISHFKIADFAVQSGQIGSGTLGGVLGNREVASGSIGSLDLGSGIILSLYIGSGAVQSGGHASGSISRNKLASGILLSGFQIGSGTILGQLGGAQFHIASGTVGINDLGITEAPDGTKFLRDDFSWQAVSVALGSGNVQSGHIASGAVQGFFGSTRHVASGTLGVFDFGSGAVVAGTVGSGAIQSGNIASGQVGGSHYGSGSVQSGAYASGSISHFKIAALAITSGQIGSGTLGGVLGNREIASGTIGTFDIGSGQIVSGLIGSGQVGSKHVASGVLPSLGYVYGLGLEYVNSGRIFMRSGIARDSTDSVFLVLPDQQNITISGTNAGVNGMDISPIGNVHILTSGQVVSGPDMYNHFPIRTGTGLIAVSGLTAIVGSGGDVLYQAAVGDLVGSSGQGFWRVTAVNSGIMTVAVSGGGVSGSIFQVIENAYFTTSGATSRYIDRILSGVSMSISNVPSASGSAVPGFIGGAPGASGGTVQSYLMTWIGNGLSGTGVFLSTQRTRPMYSGVIGWIESGFRRVGSVMYNGASGMVIPFNQVGYGTARSVTFEIATQEHQSRALAGGNATSWTPLIGSIITPPTLESLLLGVILVQAGVATSLYVRNRDQGSSTTTRPLRTFVERSGSGETIVILPCNPAALFDYVMGNGTSNPGIIEVGGYWENL